MRDPVGHIVIDRVIQSDHVRLELIKRPDQLARDPLDISDDVVPSAGLTNVLHIPDRDDRAVVASSRDEKRRLPGNAGADNQRHARITENIAFASDDHPQIDALLFEHLDRLCQLLPNDRIICHCPPRPASRPAIGASSRP